MVSTTRVALASAAVVATASFLSACGSSSSKAARSTSDTSSSTSVTSASSSTSVTTTSASSTPATSDSSAPVTAGDYKGLGKTVVDDSTIGDKIMVSEIKLVPVPQALQSKYFRLKGDHFVVAKVTLTPGGKVGTGYTDMIKLFDGPEDTIGNYALDATSLPDDVAALTAAGYPLVTIDGKSSAPVSGYIAFLHDDSKSGPLRIVLHRQAATLTDFGLGGGGETTEQVSAKDFPVIN